MAATIKADPNGAYMHKDYLQALYNNYASTIEKIDCVEDSQGLMLAVLGAIAILASYFFYKGNLDHITFFATLGASIGVGIISHLCFFSLRNTYVKSLDFFPEENSEAGEKVDAATPEEGSQAEQPEGDEGDNSAEGDEEA